MRNKPAKSIHLSLTSKNEELSPSPHFGIHSECFPAHKSSIYCEMYPETIQMLSKVSPCAQTPRWSPAMRAVGDVGRGRKGLIMH